MSEEQIKKAAELAHKEFQKEKEEAVAKVVKDIVRETLEKIEKLEEQIKDLQEQKKQLKMTIDDLKEGKMGLLKERLEKDKSASEVLKIKVVEIHQPITINYPQPSYPFWSKPWTVYYQGEGFSGGYVSTTGTARDICNAVNGTYCLTSGSTVTLR